MKTRILFATGMMLLLASFTSCKKSKSGSSTQTSKQLRSVTKRMFVPGGLDTSRLGFEYDSRGRLTRYVNLQTNLPLETYEYSGDIPTRKVQYSPDGSVWRTIESPYRVSSNGDTIVYTQLTARSGGEDLYRETYVFHDSVLIEQQVYYLRAGETFPQTNSRWVYMYDTNDNLHHCSFDDGTASQLLYTVTGVDRNRNFRRTLSRFNYLLINDLLEQNGRSINNVLSTQSATGAIMEFEWTYDSDGHPLTCKRKNESFVAYEWMYSE